MIVGHSSFDTVQAVKVPSAVAACRLRRAALFFVVGGIPGFRAPRRVQYACRVLLESGTWRLVLTCNTRQATFGEFAC